VPRMDPRPIIIAPNRPTCRFKLETLFIHNHLPVFSVAFHNRFVLFPLIADRVVDLAGQLQERTHGIRLTELKRDCTH
jgi:hypothetical protein